MRTKFSGLYLSVASVALGVVCSVAPVHAQSTSEGPGLKWRHRGSDRHGHAPHRETEKVPLSISAFSTRKWTC